VFIAAEHGRTLGTPLPGAARVSVATLTGLHLGVLNAQVAHVRRLDCRRQRRVSFVRSEPEDGGQRRVDGTKLFGVEATP
jgi:hypothetical protein